MSTAVRHKQTYGARRQHGVRRGVTRAPLWLIVGLGCALGLVLLAQMAGLAAAAWALSGAAALCLCLVGLLVAWPTAPHGTLRIEALYALGPAEFERYVADLFAASGYAVRVVGGSGDGGVDVRVWREGWCGVVQCKRYRPDRALGPAAVRELVGTRAHERARYAWLATTASLSPAARQLAREEGIGVLDAERLASYGRRARLARWLGDWRLR